MMNDFWQSLKNIFKSAEESTASNPTIHEVIERTQQEKEDYEFWKETLVCRRLLNWLSDQYAVYQVLPKDTDEALDFLDTPSVKGFVIHFHQTEFSKRDVTHLFDYLKEQVSNLDYKVQISDSRTFNRENWVETIDRHYLKPRINFEKGKPSNQRYGNISVEIVLKNDRVFHLKFQATNYNDRKYTEAEDFRGLMQIILG